MLIQHRNIEPTLVKYWLNVICLQEKIFNKTETENPFNYRKNSKYWDTQTNYRSCP